MITIYFIDDEPILVMLVKRFLKSESDIQVTTFDKAEDALSQIKEGKKPDLVVSDIKMPGMSGFELARELIDGDHLRDMKFTYCTSFSSLEGASDVYGIERKDLLEFPMYKKPISAAFASFIRKHAGPDN